MRVLLNPGDEIESDATTNDKILIHGYTSPQTIDVVFKKLLTTQSYTTTPGKQFYLTNVIFSQILYSGVSLRVFFNGLEAGQGPDDNDFMILEGGTVITTNMPAGNRVFINGYYRD